MMDFKSFRDTHFHQYKVKNINKRPFFDPYNKTVLEFFSMDEKMDFEEVC